MGTSVLSPAELSPALNITLITNKSQLQLLTDFFNRCSLFGMDTETNVVSSFIDRKLRTIQVGNREEQYVVDLLGFSQTTDQLMEQGNCRTPEWAKSLVETLNQGLHSGNHVKVGVNLQFDYEILRWGLGIRPYKFWDCMMVEKLIYCGRIPFMQKDFWGMDDMVLRYLKKQLSKDEQKSFDLSTPLTQNQIEYCAMDVRVPLALRQCQLPIVEKAGLSTVARLENDAIPSFGDLHINGIYLDGEQWKREVDNTAVKHAEHVAKLDEFFLPVVGSADCPELELERLEKEWREEKDKVVRAERRKAYQAASKSMTAWRKAKDKWEGKAAINYNASPQILTALRKLGFNEKQLPSTNDKVLHTLKEHEVIQAIQKYRETSKIDSTYGYSFVDENISTITGRLHSKFNQLGAETGRVSSSSPNMQNIPNGVWRTCFKAGMGNKLVTVDMSGAELRIAAELSGEESWLKAFANNVDVHSVCASMMQPDAWAAGTESNCAFVAKGEKCKCKVHKEIRNAAKAINFGVMYGKEYRALADDLGISHKEAKALLELWRNTFKKVAAFLKAAGEYAKIHLCSRTMSGRRRLFDRPDWNVARKLAMEQAEEDGKDPYSITSDDISRAFRGMYSRIDRQGKNTPIQGTNADIAKVAMALLWDKLTDYNALLVGMVHDEVIFEVPEEHAEAVLQLVMDCIREAGAQFMKLVVMEAEGAISDCWKKG